MCRRVPLYRWQHSDAFDQRETSKEGHGIHPSEDGCRTPRTVDKSGHPGRKFKAWHPSTGPLAPVGLQGPRGLHRGGGGKPRQGGKGLRGNTEFRDPWFQGSTVRSAIGVDSGPRVTGFDPLFVNFIRLSLEGNWRQVWVAGGERTQLQEISIS